MVSPLLLPAIVLGITISIFIRIGRARQRLEFRARILELMGLACKRGLPLAPLLGAALREHRGPRQIAAAAIHRTLAEGGTVAEAFESAGTPWFGRHIAAAARATEGTDSLGDTLSALAAEDGRTLEGRHQVQLALIYPALLGVLAFGLFSLVNVRLAGSGGWMFHSSPLGFVASAGIWLGVAAALAWAASRLMRRYGIVSPGSGVVHRARLLRLTGIFTAAGLAVPEALRRAGEACDHRRLARSSLEVADRLELGEHTPEAWAPLRMPAAITLRLGALGATRAQETFAGLAARLLNAHARGQERLLRWMQPVSIAVVAGVVLIQYATLMQVINHHRGTVGLW